jgi:hypothetical protein
MLLNTHTHAHTHAHTHHGTFLKIYMDIRLYSAVLLTVIILLPQSILVYFHYTSYKLNEHQIKYNEQKLLIKNFKNTK